MKSSAVIPSAPPPSTPRPEAIHVAWITLPAALLDVTAGALVVNHAATAPDMHPVVWVIACTLHLFLLTTYHVGHATHSRSRALFVLALLLFGGLLGLVLWDHGQPHPAWNGATLAMSQRAYALLIAAACISLPGFAALYHYLVLGRIRRVTQADADAAPSNPPLP